MASASVEAATRTRIVNHMNKDHQRELANYLRHFCKLPEWRVAQPVMKDISLDNLTIQSTDGATHLIPFDPPMNSFSEARNRVVEMDKTARKALGLADVDITVYAAPRGVDVLVFGAVVFYYVCFFTLPWAVEGSPIWAFWDAVFPGGAGVYRWVVKTIFVPVLGIHLTEMAILHRTRMRPYGIVAGTGVWWKWMGSCFFEGYPSFRRFDRLVAEKRGLKETKGGKGR
ncbi:hypothetical protein jhhlp_001081 [Lomentospora prolificans]|uniref:DUF2470 domain-containing protein n=1 Tax=Lomentospora prolificans TaxID=41688 RepID=A0A2N3NH83_9PEZI|nr:hypothetical protein jhhlp_001081 [Lomentospora prolificans]